MAESGLYRKDSTRGAFPEIDKLVWQPRPGSAYTYPHPGEPGADLRAHLRRYARYTRKSRGKYHV